MLSRYTVNMSLPNPAKARAVAVFHGCFTVFLFGGFVAQFFWRPLAFVILVLASGTLIAEVVYRGCPFTILENRYRREPSYGRYEGSFIRHYLKRYAGLNVPRGLVPLLIGLGLIASVVLVLQHG